jgi:L-lactate permease
MVGLFGLSVTPQAIIGLLLVGMGFGPVIAVGIWVAWQLLLLGLLLVGFWFIFRPPAEPPR